MATAIVLAGGLGTRLRNEVPDVPKPMAPINGRPFLEYLLDYWVGQGITRFILSIGYKSKVIVDHFGSVYKGAQVDYAIESRPLGTGGGLLLALEKVDDPDVLLLNGDTFFSVSLRELHQFYLNRNADCVFSLFPAAEPGRFMGLDLDSQGRIFSLAADNKKVGRLANGGVYIIRCNAIRELNLPKATKISLEDDIFLKMLEGSFSVYGVKFDSTFIDIGIPFDYKRAAELLG